MADTLTSTNGTGRRALLQELGVTGLRHQGGVLYEEWARQLRTIRQRTAIFQEMQDNHPIIGASIHVYDTLIRQVSRTIQPADDSLPAQEGADFLAGVFDDMAQSMDETLTQANSFLPFGWSALEIVYKKRQGPQVAPDLASRFTDGKIGWQALAIRGQDILDHWEFADGRLVALHQRDWLTGQACRIPLEKLLLFRLGGRHGSPEGRSILRSAYVPYQYHKQIQTFQGIGIERDLAGLPVVSVPPEILQPVTADQAAALHAFKTLATNIRRDEQEGIVFPLAYDQQGKELYKLALLSTGGARQFNTREILEYYDKNIALAMLTDIILLGQHTSGNRALGETKVSLMSTTIEAITQHIAGVLNRHAIPALWRLNGFPDETRPTLVFGDVDQIDLNDLGNLILRLSQAGFDLTDTEDEVRRMARLPQRTEGAV